MGAVVVAVVVVAWPPGRDLSGCRLSLLLSHSHVRYLNANGSIAVPWKVGPDGRSGEQPRGVEVSRNLGREIGIWQKQSSLWFQAVSAATRLRGNVFFNGPRAALNFNDGCARLPPDDRVMTAL